LQVIYGDTDSIMIHTGTSDVAAARQLGASIKREVNRRYRLLEIELDAVYKTMLLLKKKKYAGKASFWSLQVPVYWFFTMQCFSLSNIAGAIGAHVEGGAGAEHPLHKQTTEPFQLSSLRQVEWAYRCHQPVTAYPSCIHQLHPSSLVQLELNKLQQFNALSPKQQELAGFSSPLSRVTHSM
jgi:hypothetical protein